MKLPTYIDEPIYTYIKQKPIAAGITEWLGRNPKIVRFTNGTRRIYIDWIKDRKMGNWGDL